MKPFVVCHMMASLDGRIDCDMLDALGESKNYYETLKRLKCQAFIEGRVSRAMHAAAPGKFSDEGGARAGAAVYRAVNDAPNGWAVALDTRGRLLWDENHVDGKPLLCIVSEAAPEAYLKYLHEKDISYIATGEQKIDLAQALDLLAEKFDIKRIAVVGGGHVNAAFLAAGLLDEISMLYGPIIDGRAGMAAAFDGLLAGTAPRIVKLSGVEQFDDGCVWMRYVLGQAKPEAKAEAKSETRTAKAETKAKASSKK